MELSLEFIMKKLSLKSDNALLMAPNKSLFSEILLLSPQISTLKNGVLYVGDKLVHPDIKFESGCGLLIHNESRALPCDVLYVKNSIPIEELFNQISEIFNYYRKQIEKLTQMVYQKKELQEVIEKVSEICENPAYIVDSSFKVLAISNYLCKMDELWSTLLSERYHPFDLMTNLIKSNELNELELGSCANIFVSKYFEFPFINYNMRYEGRLQGHLFIIGMNIELTPKDIEIVNLIGPLVCQAVLVDPNFQTTRGNHYEHFIIDMIEGKNMKQEHMDNQAGFVGFKKESFYAIAKIKPLLKKEMILEQIANQLEHFIGSNPIIYKDFIVVIFQLDTNNYNNKFNEKLQILDNQFSCVIGISDIMRTYNNIHLQFIQASDSIALGEMLDKNNNLYLYHDFAIYSPLLSITNKNDLLVMCHPGVMHLCDYDKRNNTEYALTLEVYLKNERQSLLTASKLHIHRNTLSYRLEKINTICNFDLDDYNERERIILTFNIHGFLLNYI